MNTYHAEMTEIGVKLLNQYEMYDLEMLHENYSCTIDFNGYMTDSIKAQIERQGFTVTHERGSIYTITHEYKS